MNLKSIIAIAGKPGLYKVVAQGNQSIIVESLVDKKRSAANASNKISALEDISIYTDGEDILLSEVYRSIYDKENGGPCISHKANEAELRAYLSEVLPNYDQERVYFSDIKKLFNWYNMLHSAELLIPLENDESEESSESTEDSPKKDKKAPVKTTAKSTAVKAAPKTPSTGSKAPVKKPTVQRKSS